MEIWLLQYGALGVAIIVMFAYIQQLRTRLNGHEASCAERNEKLATALGKIDQRLEHGDHIIERLEVSNQALIVSNNQLNQTVAVLMDRGGRPE